MMFASLIVALTAVMAPEPAGAFRATTAECKVGEVVLHRALRGRRETGALIVSPQPVGKTPLLSPDFAGRPDAVLPSALIAAWESEPPSNLFQACPALERRLPRGWRYSRPEEEAAIIRPNIKQFGKPLVRGDLALVEVGEACSGLCGTSTVQLYRRTHGRWRYVAPAALGFS